MIKLLSVLAILVAAVLCDDQLIQPNWNFRQEHKFGTQTLFTKPCTRRFFPNPIIDSRWVPSLPQPQNPTVAISEIQAKEGQRSPAPEESKFQDFESSAESKSGQSSPINFDSTSNQNEEQSRRAENSSEDLQKAQDDESSPDLQSFEVRSEIDSNDKSNCVQEMQFNDQQNYRRFMFDTDDLANDQNAAAQNDELKDPTQGVGVTGLSESRHPFIGNSRVCYACTSAGNPNCLIPDKRTTVKYCQRDHDSCVTKTYQNQDELVVIRDCAASCRQSSITGLEPKYKTCNICHADLCNGASSMTSQALMILLFIGTFLKFANSTNLFA